MTSIPSRKVLKNLYLNQKMSMQQIATKLNVSLHKISYWMDKYKVGKRPRPIANYYRSNPNGNPFNIKESLTVEETKLKYLSLGIYWGEGNKTNKYAIRVTNSDPGVINIFRNYLVTLCNIQPSRLHYYLQIFKDNNSATARNYWAKTIHIEPHTINISKPIPPLGKGTYRKINQHGVMSLAFFNIHLKAYIIKQLSLLGAHDTPTKPR